MRGRRRPAVLTKCVADHYHSTDQRIVEVAFPSGKGCLISLCGDGRIQLYRVDAGMTVSVGGEEGTVVRFTREEYASPRHRAVTVKSAPKGRKRGGVYAAK